MTRVASKKQGAVSKVRIPNRRQSNGTVEVQRSQWRSALITDERLSHYVSLRAITNEGSTLAGRAGSSATKLWEVGVEIEHQQPTPSVYTREETRPQYANPDDTAFVTLTVSCPRGDLTTGRESGKVEPQETVVHCQLGHIDALVLALANALIVGRRDGTFPIVRGMKPFSAATLAAMHDE